MTTAAPLGWLLLIHQIPPKPDYFRVKVRRRLDRLGAIALKNSVYLLPNTDETVEDFQWLRREIVDDGGEATLCIASFVEGVTDQELIRMFVERSDAEYGEIVDAARASATDPSESEVRRLKRRLAESAARDFFDAPGAQVAQRSVGDVEATLASLRQVETAPVEDVEVGFPGGACWVTREGVYVDRIASAWLVRRFIDETARFKFVPAQGYQPEHGELRFDMYEGEFTHEGDRCTFETLLERFRPEDASLRAIAEIVHDIDLKDEKFDREEAAGVASVLRGIVLTHSEDIMRVEAGYSLFDGLYAAFERRGV